MTEKEIQSLQYYDLNAEEFAHSSFNANMSSTCNEFLSYLQPGSNILDLGCGTGRDSKYFIDCGYKVLPVDGSEKMCRIATKISGVFARQMLFQEIDFKEKFDGIWACASLLHVERKSIPEILQRISNALKNNGILYMSFKYGSGDKERNGRFFTDMTESDIPFLCENFQIIRTFVSEDVRSNRAGEKWLNLLLRKK